MKNFKKLVIVALIVIGFSGCAAKPQMDYSSLNSSVVTPTQDRALVYFLRPKMLGWPNHAAVYDDTTFLGFVPYNSQFAYLAEPGEHLFMVTSEAADFLKADLMSGKTYYVQVMPRMGVWRARFSLIPVSKENIGSSQVQEWVANSVNVESNDAAFKWAEKNRKGELEKKQKYYLKWMEKPEYQRPYLTAEDSI